MNELQLEIAKYAIGAAASLGGSSVVWLVKKAWEAKVSLDDAHATIRILMEQTGLTQDDKKKVIHLYRRK